MRTVHNRSRLLVGGGGCLLLGLSVPKGVCLLQGGSGLGGVSAPRGGIPACTKVDPFVDRQTGVKT